MDVLYSFVQNFLEASRFSSSSEVFSIESDLSMEKFFCTSARSESSENHFNSLIEKFCTEA